jgi:hypothetical protein
VGPKGPGLIKKYPAVAVFYEIRGPKGPEKENVCRLNIPIKNHSQIKEGPLSGKISRGLWLIIGWPN